MNKFQAEYSQLSENPLLLPCTPNSSCELTCRRLLQDELFSSYWRLHRFIHMVTTNCTIHFMYGVPFVSKFRIWIKMQVFMKLTGIYDHIAIYILVRIYTWYWYLRTILVFTNDTGIYVPYWYLCMIVAFTCDIDIYYAQCYTTQQFEYHKISLIHFCTLDPTNPINTYWYEPY